MKKLKFRIFYLILILSSCLVSQLIFSPALAEQIKVYDIPLYYDKGSVVFGEITTRLGFLPPAESQEAVKNAAYYIELVSFKKTVLESKSFSFPLSVVPPPPLPGEKPVSPIILDQASTLIVLPYHPDGQFLNIYNRERKLLVGKDVAYLSEMCGDGICQDHESFESCSKDCQSSALDGYCNPGQLATDPDCQRQNQTANGQINSPNNNAGNNGSTAKTSYFLILIIVIVIVAAILMAVIYYFYNKRKNAGY